MYPNGVPDWEKLGFIQLNTIGRGGNFTEDIPVVCQILDRQSSFVDPAGYTNECTAAAIDPERERYAWVECQSKAPDSNGFVDVNFYLYAIVATQIVVKWEIETYNPYFGCQVELIHWLPEHLIFIYHEKHDTFICAFDLHPIDPAQLPISEPIDRQEISDEWEIQAETVIFKRWDRIERLALPNLNRIEP